MHPILAEGNKSQLLSMVWVNKRWTSYSQERKTSSREEMEEHKVNYFQGLVQTGKHKVSKVAHTDKCKFYTQRIALASSSKEVHQIVITLSNRHPPKILPTIYLSADLTSIFIKHTWWSLVFFYFFFCLELYSKWCQVCPITVII